MKMCMLKRFDSTALTAHTVADRGLWDESGTKWQQNGEVANLVPRVFLLPNLAAAWHTAN